VRDSEEPEGDVVVRYKEVTKQILGKPKKIAEYKISINNGNIVAAKYKVVVDYTDSEKISESQIALIDEIAETVYPTDINKIKVYLYDAEGKQVGEAYELTPIKVADW